MSAQTLLDRSVRARTRPGRLAAIDAFVGPLPPGSTAIDFGFGETPVTTLEWARALGPAVTVLGVEREPARVERARLSAPTLHFILGGFEALAALGPATVVRAMNVLRAYPAEHLDAAHRALAGHWPARACSSRAAPTPTGTSPPPMSFEKTMGGSSTKACSFTPPSSAARGPGSFVTHCLATCAAPSPQGRPFIVFWSNGTAASKAARGLPASASAAAPLHCQTSLAGHRAAFFGALKTRPLGTYAVTHIETSDSAAVRSASPAPGGSD